NEHAASVLWKYHNRPQEELYDMEADPNELQNLIGDSKFKKLLEGYRKTLADWRKQQNDTVKGPEEIKEEPLKKGTKPVAPYIFLD
ncbi:MAG: hypothetical protein WKF85_06760, partial [Chitinophagaceae bacterium]